MNALANNIRISELPYYCKSFSSRQVCPELDCYWSSLNCSFPFILAITGNIATPETFPFNKKDYRRTGDVFTYSRKASARGGRYGLEFSFEILEEKATGNKFAIIIDVVRNGGCY